MTATSKETETAIQTWILRAFSEVPARADVQVDYSQISQITLLLQSLKAKLAADNRTAVALSPFCSFLFCVVTYPATLRNFTWQKHCGGFYELPAAA
jgi:hypothetical protein